MERDLVDPSRIVTHRFDLDQIHEAMEMMEISQRVKVMVRP